MAKTISKGRLKAKMLEIFRELEASGDELVVTNHGKPVLKVIPFKEKGTVAEIFGDIQDQVIYLEDINTPTFE